MQGFDGVAFEGKGIGRVEEECVPRLSWRKLKGRLLTIER